MDHHIKRIRELEAVVTRLTLERDARAAIAQAFAQTFELPEDHIRQRLTALGLECEEVTIAQLPKGVRCVWVTAHAGKERWRVELNVAIRQNGAVT